MPPGQHEEFDYYMMVEKVAKNTGASPVAINKTIEEIARRSYYTPKEILSTASNYLDEGESLKRAFELAAVTALRRDDEIW